MKNKNGISMISLVITIIVIIILVSITYGVSLLAVERAEYAKFVNNLKQVQEAMDNANLKVRRETIVKGKVLTNSQIYTYPDISYVNNNFTQSTILIHFHNT